jgi:hypothetical protein
MTEPNFFAQFDSLRSAPPPAGRVSPYDPDENGVVVGPTGVPQITIHPRSAMSEDDQGPNYFAQFDHLRDQSSARTSSVGSIARQLPVGFNEGLTDVVGLPVDAMTWALNKGIEGANYLTGADIPEITHPVGGSESLKDVLGVIGADPRKTPATTAPERIARATGAGAAAMIALEAEVALLGRAGVLSPEIVEGAGRYFGRSAGAGDVVGSAGVGAAGGAGGEAAAEVSPPAYQPLARVGGVVVGGGLGLAGVAGVRAIPGAVRGAGEFVAPMTETGREALAARMLESRAENPTAVRDALANAPQEIVPGSKPTTFQLTGDMGLGALEREQQTKYPADFMQRRADQNTARIDALTAIQPTGSPVEVAKTLRASLQDIDAITHGAVERAAQEAQRAVQGLGGEGSPEQYGAALRGVLQDAENAAQPTTARCGALSTPMGG